MKVRVHLEIELDPDAWNEEYATSDSRDEIRAQVRGQAVDAVDIALKHLQPETVQQVTAL